MRYGYSFDWIGLIWMSGWKEYDGRIDGWIER